MLNIIGFGSIGKLIAHTLRSTGQRVNVILRTSKANEAIVKQGSTHRLSKISNSGDIQAGSSLTGITFENAQNIQGHKALVVVCTKAYASAEAFHSIRASLDHKSVVVLLNNGIGVCDEFRASFDEHRRPQIVEGLISHGAYTCSDDGDATASSFVHAGLGYLQFATQSTEIKTLECLKHLCAGLGPLDPQILSYPEFQKAQMDKLLVNSIINPITAISGIKNGDVAQFSPLIERLIREWILVMRRTAPSMSTDYEEARLLVDSVIEKTSNNKSSMLQDVMSGSRTEIEYINGYIVREGRRHGCDVRFNEALTTLVWQIHHS